MKKFKFALPILAAALAITPIAMANSFNYTINGQNFTANLNFYTGPEGTANGVTGLGDVYTINWVSGIFQIIGNPAVTFGITPTETADPGANANNLTFSPDGGFLFDNLLYPGNPGGDPTENGILDWGGVLIDIGGYELNVFSDSQGSGAPADDGSFYFADNGSYHSNIRIPLIVNPVDPAPATLTLTSTETFSPVPEPGSLFLLGTGLLVLALVLFRKAGKRSSHPVSNS